MSERSRGTDRGPDNAGSSGNGGFSRRGFLRALGAGAVAGAAVLAGIRFSRDEERDDIPPAEDGVDRRSLQPEQGEAVPQNDQERKFNEYTPPPEGVIVKKFFKSGNRKTVIYIADEHPIDGADKQKLPKAFNAQRELYFIIEDIVRKYGQVPLVLENWPIGLTTQHIVEAKGDTFIEAGQDPDGVMKRIIGERDFSKRAEISHQSVGNNIVPGSMFAMLSYPDKVIPIGSVTMQELEELDALTRSFFSSSSAIDHPSEVKCSNTLTFAQAKDAFEKGKRGKSVVDCYCAVRHEVLAIVEAFFNDRLVLSPRREMVSALTVFDSGSDFAVIAAGINHIPESLKLLDERGDINYIVVSPRSIQDAFPRALTTPIVPTINLEDDKDGTCARRIQELQSEQQRRMIEQLLKDDEE